VSHVNGCTFVSHINDADAFSCSTHPNWHYVTAAQSEKPVNAAGP
jgi:hypothetical protein